MPKNNSGSVPATVNGLKPGSTIVFVRENTAQFMRTLAGQKMRGYIMVPIVYKKASIIIDDILYQGVAVSRIPDEDAHGIKMPDGAILDMRKDKG